MTLTSSPPLQIQKWNREDRLRAASPESLWCGTRRNCLHQPRLEHERGVRAPEALASCLFLTYGIVSWIFPGNCVDRLSTLQKAEATRRVGSWLCRCGERGNRMHRLSRGSGFPVLFIHGIPTSSHLWHAVLDNLLGRFSCLAIDLASLGRSPNDRGSVNQLEALARRIERIGVEHHIDKWELLNFFAGAAPACTGVTAA